MRPYNQALGEIDESNGSQLLRKVNRDSDALQFFGSAKFVLCLAFAG